MKTNYNALGGEHCYYPCIASSQSNPEFNWFHVDDNIHVLITSQINMFGVR